MADHFISLLLGRPSILKLSDASIPETSDLPDLSWIDDYTYAGYLKLKGRHQTTAVTSYISDPLNQIINLINISDNMLNDIFTKSDDLGGDHQGNDDTDLNLNSRWEKLFQYNRQIVSWKKSLPKDLQWDRESLSKTERTRRILVSDTTTIYYCFVSTVRLLVLRTTTRGPVKMSCRRCRFVSKRLTICMSPSTDSSGSMDTECVLYSLCTRRYCRSPFCC